MYTYDARVTTSCTGTDGRQTPVSVVTMMQDCSMLWMGSEPALTAYLKEQNAAMMVASRQVDFLRFPEYGERLQVRTTIYKFRGKMGFRNTVIVDENCDMTAMCWAIGVFVGYETGKMIEIPKEVVETVKMDPQVDMDYQKRKIVLPKVEPTELPGIMALRSDLDFNGHVNNAQYVRMACDLLPDGLEVRRLRIVHEGQAREGQRIHPLLYREDDRRVYRLNGDDGRPFATVELS